MRGVARAITICRRELAGYRATPPAYICLAGFPLSAGVLTFFAGNFFEGGDADLDAFFQFQPWLCLALAALLSMRLWAAETGYGTHELLLSLPVRPAEAVIGKFLSAWVLIGLALALTLPLWLTADLLSRPDNGIVGVAYAASWLMAGALTAIGEAVSAASQSQVTAFVATVAALGPIIALGSTPISTLLPGAIPPPLAAAVAAASPARHFAALVGGDVRLLDLAYFLSLTIGALAATTVIVDLKTAD